jgi:threonine dehydrogenase-like Zn-dependent dehydrogenase
MSVTGLCGSDRKSSHPSHPSIPIVHRLHQSHSLHWMRELKLTHPVHYYSHGANGIFKIQAPMVLGHEASGIITSLPQTLPPGCTLQVGDKVALEVGVYCKVCKYCKKGRYNLCSGMRFASSAKTFPHLDGTLTEVMCHPVDLLHK